MVAEAVQEFLTALEEAPEGEPHSLMVLRHGSVVAAGWWWPYTAPRPHLLYSLSKNLDVNVKDHLQPAVAPGQSPNRRPEICSYARM